MSKVNYAAIDIGSNAVRLLIKKYQSRNIGTVVYKRAPSKGSPASGRRSIYTR